MPPGGGGGGGGDDGSGGREGDSGSGSGWNRNVVLSYAWNLFNGTAYGIWGSTIFTLYIKQVYSKDTAMLVIGYAQGLQGTLQAVLALPAGWAADRFRRDRILLIAAVLASGGMATTIAMVYETGTLRTVMLYGAAGLWGAYMGVVSAPQEALFGDSIQTGLRAKIYTWRGMLNSVARGLGPLVGLLCFIWLGDEWKVDSIRTVLLVGVYITSLPIITLVLFDDDKAMGEESEGVNAARADKSAHLHPAGNVDDCCMMGAKAVPWLIFLSNLTGAFATGMTVKFFPVFFADPPISLQPIALQAVFAATPIVMAGGMWATERIAQHFGRIQTVQLERLIGTLLLLLMAIRKIGGYDIWANQYLIIGIYLVRTVLMSCGWPLLNSVLNDYVSKASRARWNSVQTVAALGWSGSAAIGGLLLTCQDPPACKHSNFSLVFYVTFAIQMLSWFIRLPLMFIVPKHSLRHKAIAITVSEALLPEDENDDTASVDFPDWENASDFFSSSNRPSVSRSRCTSANRSRASSWGSITSH